jgi:hypothetical protein
MCGLTGIAGDGIVTRDMHALQDLLAISTIRGQDGTGVIQGRFWEPEDAKKNTIFSFKQSYEVNYFLWVHTRTDKANKLLFSLFDNVHAYHVRWATKGDINEDNCHPFEMPSFIGMHNGTLKEKKYDDVTKTDSEVLFEEIEEKGLEKTLSELRSDSAYALVMVSKTTGEITFVRNKHRSLYCAFNSERDVMYWHSEDGALTYILDRHDIKHHGVVEVTAGKVHKILPWDIDCKKPGFDTLEDLPVSTVPFEAAITSTGWGGRVQLGAEARALLNDHEYALWMQEYGDPHQLGSYYGNLAPWMDWEPEKAKIIDVVPEPVTTNIVDFRRHKHRLTPHYSCIGCNRDLNLVDQYHAAKTTTKEGIQLFECEDCVTSREKLVAHHLTMN